MNEYFLKYKINHNNRRQSVSRLFTKVIEAKSANDAIKEIVLYGHQKEIELISITKI